MTSASVTGSYCRVPFLQRLSVVTTKGWHVPRVEWIPQVNHGRLLRELGVIAGHDIRLSDRVVLLVIFREHAILLGSSQPLLLCVSIGGRLPQVVPRSRASHAPLDSDHAGPAHQQLADGNRAHPADSLVEVNQAIKA